MERQPTGEAIRAKEQQDMPPFVIRAHHLASFKKILKSGMPVSDLVDTYFKSLVKRRASFRHLSRDSQWYINDILGSMQEQADKYRRYEEEFYEEFLQLPPDYPVKIVQGQKDKICQGCAIGEHCSERPRLLWDSDTDKIYTRAFRKAAKKLNLKADLTVADEIATCFNAKPTKVKSILTTAGTVRKVILLKSGSSLFS